MKKVFQNSDDVMHAFAQQQQEEGRNSSGNVYFQKSTDWEHEYANEIYSYGRHYLLGQFLDSSTILINDAGYSATTAKHISQVTWATSQYKRFFTTRCELKHVYYSVTVAKNKLANARKPEKYINEILGLWSSMNEYHEWNRTHKKIAKSNYKPYHDVRYKEIKSIVKALESDSSDDYRLKLREAEQKEKKRKEAANKRALKEALAKFNNHEIRSFRIGEEDYLRLSKDGVFVETSQGVSVPVREAKILYSMIKRGEDIKGHRISNYSVTSLNGVLTIGCHRINMNSVNKIGEAII